MLKRAPRSKKPVLRRLGHRLNRIWHEVLTQHDAPHRIALGVSLGFFIGWLPIVGVQMLICLLLCWLLRANFVATLPGVWLSNPVTMVPMYWLENHVGAWFAGRAITREAMAGIWGRIDALISEHGLFSGSWEGFKYLFTEFFDASMAMFIGGFLIGTISAVAVYVPSLRMVERYHARRSERRAHWSERCHRVEPTADSPEPAPDDDVHHDKEAV